jgi:hypothetical protein
MKFKYLFLLLFVTSCTKNVVKVNDNLIVKNKIVTDTVKKIDTSIFNGYVVNQNAKQLGRDYWENITIPADLMLSIFQTSLKHSTGHTDIETETVSFGDFNLDGYIDIFNAGGSHNGPYTGFTFLMWNPTSKIFEQKNLFNDKSFVLIGGNPNKIIPIYLNQDNYVDFIIFDGGDEDLPNRNPPNEPIRYVLSDGKGGYDLKAIETNESETDYGHRKFGGDIGDIDGDGVPDLVIACNTLLYFYKGIPTFPYFITTNRIKYIHSSWTRIKDIDNKFDIISSEFTDHVFDIEIVDFNKDNKNDIVTIGKENNTGLRQRILLNKGGMWGDNFSKEHLIKLPERISQKTFETRDLIITDLDNDGDNDIVGLGHDGNFLNWCLYFYKQNTITNYDVINIESNIGNNATKLIYQDFNNDGFKDIGFQESNGNTKVSRYINNIYNKKVYIREVNTFIGKSIYDFDTYSKELRDKYFINN